MCGIVSAPTPAVDTKFNHPIIICSTPINGTQLISLHLALHRPPRVGGRSTDPTFGPYISVLPREFDAHPLTWLIKQDSAAFEEEDAVFGQELLNHLSPSVSSELKAVSNKFLKDWTIVRDSWEAHAKAPGAVKVDAPMVGAPSVYGKTLRYPNFLWAWLIGTSIQIPFEHPFLRTVTRTPLSSKRVPR